MKALTAPIYDAKRELLLLAHRFPGLSFLDAVTETRAFGMFPPLLESLTKVPPRRVHAILELSSLIICVQSLSRHGAQTPLVVPAILNQNSLSLLSA